MNHREISCKRLFNLQFAGVLVFIGFNYFSFVFQYLIFRKPILYILLLVIFHIFFIMLIWSMGKSILGDPGRVPIYWGFFSQDIDNQNRRYCLLCHSFKPERCHHCSTCQRCVLNMDHHCPWIANCVGFSNRKFFMLFIFYIIVTLLFCITCEIPLLIQQLIQIVKQEQALTAHTVIRSLTLLIQIAFLVVISNFFKYHVELVFSNSSTLDSLERQRNKSIGPNVYDIGPYENFVQVFGTNSCLWLIPVSPASAQKANGVVWPKTQ